MKLTNLRELFECISEESGTQKARNICDNIDISIVEKEIKFLLKNRRVAVELLMVLFPKGIPQSIVFYEKLSILKSSLEISSISDSLIGVVWVEAYKQLKKNESHKLLELLIEYHEIKLWDFIRVLPVFISEIELTSDFATDWFLEINNKVKADYLNGGFYQALEAYGLLYPESAIKVLEHYISVGLNDNEVQLASILLGSVRISTKNDATKMQYTSILDERLMNALQVGQRRCFYWSWANSNCVKSLSIKKLRAFLENMLNGADDEILDAYSILEKCLIYRYESKGFTRFAVKWLHKHTSPGLPTAAKSQVVHCIYLLSNIFKTDKLDLDKEKCDQIIIRILPITSEKEGIRNNIDYYLSSRIKEDFESFEELMIQIGIRDFMLARSLLEGHQGTVKYELAKSDASQLITKFLLSANSVVRRLGMLLFKEIEIKAFSKIELVKADNRQLRFFVLEFMSYPLSGDDTSRFFLLLEPRFRSSKKLLKEEFRFEMVRQGINYPGNCLDQWKKKQRKSRFLKSIISSAEKYFESVNKTTRLSANSFAFPEFKDAVLNWRRDFNREISEGMNEKSFFSQMFKHTDIVYGSQFTVAFDGKIGEPTPFQEFSHEVEYPRLEVIDPVGSAYERLFALREIARLDKETE